MFSSFTDFSIYYLSELFWPELTISSLSFLIYSQKLSGFSTETSNSTDSTELYELVFYKSLFSLSDFIFRLSIVLQQQSTTSEFMLTINESLLKE